MYSFGICDWVFCSPRKRNGFLSDPIRGSLPPLCFLGSHRYFSFLVVSRSFTASHGQCDRLLCQQGSQDLENQGLDHGTEDRTIRLPCNSFQHLIVLVGSSIGNIWGFKGYLTIPEGESRNTLKVRNSDRLLNLDFSVRCDKFREVKYPGSQITKEDLSELTILKNDREELKKTIRINDPLSYKGISFYQSGHGVILPQPAEVKTEMEVIPKGGNPSGHRLQMAEGEKKQIPGTEFEIQLATFIPDFALDEGNRPFSRSDQPRNPAIGVNIYNNGKFTFSGWSFLNFPEFDRSRDDSFRVKFINFSGGKLYTSLMVVKDPGIWVLWTGLGLLMLGISMSFGFRRMSSPKAGKDD